GEHHNVDIGMDEFLERIESDKVMLLVDLHPRLNGGHQILSAHLYRFAVALHHNTGITRDVFGVGSQTVERAFQMVFENVGHRYQLDVFISRQEIHNPPPSAP